MNNLRYMVVFPLLLIMVSVVSGWYSYEKTKAEMSEDLNQALLQTTVMDVEDVENVLDSLATMPGNPMLTFNGKHNGFAKFLRIPALRDTACISYTLAYAGRMADDTSVFGHARIYSDSIVLDGRCEDGENAVIEVQAYANPTWASFLGHSGMAWSVFSFVLGLLSFVFLCIYDKDTILVSGKAVVQTSDVLTSDPRTLQLTPMQEHLMQLFYKSPNRTLSKDEICAVLWPKKENPDDSLYTFISRMKSTLNRQSTLRIENRRGREYTLVDEMDKKRS